MKKLILDTEIVKIEDDGNEYRVLIRMSQGGILEHEPFPRTLEGLVTSMQLATECLAGKFFPRRALTLSAKEQRVVDEARKQLKGPNHE